MHPPPTVRMVQWSTASEYGGIELWPTVKTRPNRAVSILCNWNETPPFVNIRPLLISKVWGNTDPMVSVPIMASVFRSHIGIGNSVCRPMNDTMQWEHRWHRWGHWVDLNVPSGAPSRMSVWYKELEMAVTSSVSIGSNRPVGESVCASALIGRSDTVESKRAGDANSLAGVCIRF